MKLESIAVAGALALTVALPAAQAQTYTIDFDDLAPGALLSNQYAALGVTFVANAFTGPSGTGEDWATNTDMTVVALSGTEVGGVGAPSLVSGNVLRSLSGWLEEDGDASFRMQFALPVTSVSVTFAGIGGVAAARLLAPDGSTLVASEGLGQQVLTYSSATPFSTLSVAPGTFTDWVAVDRITVTPVPEAGTVALWCVGLLGVAAACRRRA